MTESEYIPEFGIKRENEERRDGGCGVVFDPETQRYAVGKQHGNGSLRLFSGGVGPKEDTQKGILREVTEESGLYDFAYVEHTGDALAHYHNSLRNVNRVAKAMCLLVVLKSRNAVPVELEEHEKFDLVWVTAGEILSDLKARNGNRDVDHWIYFLQRSVKRAIELGYDTTSDIEALR